MRKGEFLFFRILLCVTAVGLTLYAYINRSNELTELRLQIPALAKELKNIQEENIRLQYEVDSFESPIHLMELARKAEFSHLKYPYVKDILIVAPGNSLKEQP